MMWSEKKIWHELWASNETTMTFDTDQFSKAILELERMYRSYADPSIDTNPKWSTLVLANSKFDDFFYVT